MTHDLAKTWADSKNCCMNEKLAENGPKLTVYAQFMMLMDDGAYRPISKELDHNTKETHLILYPESQSFSLFYDHR